MVTIIPTSKMGWGSYLNLEGPKFLGTVKYSLPTNPDFQEKCLATVVMPEGGSYNAINMYDSCVLSTGLIQLCERFFKTTELIADFSKHNSPLVDEYLAKLPIPVEIRKNAKGISRFFSPDGEIDTTEKMRKVFLSGCSGVKGHFKDDQKEFAKSVCAVFASLLGDPYFISLQTKFVRARLDSYMNPSGRAVIYTDPNKDGFSGALKALFLSYSVNNPKISSETLVLASQDPNWASSSTKDKFTIAARLFAFNPKISLWKARYKSLSPVLKLAFSVDPPTLNDLAGAPPTLPNV